MMKSFFFAITVLASLLTSHAIQTLDLEMSSGCTMKLGTFGQGLVVKCDGGKEHRSRFLEHLRKNVILPSLVKVALKTDFCSTIEALSRNTGYYSLRTRAGKGLSLSEQEEAKGILDQLSDDEIEHLLDVLKNDVVEEADVSNGTEVQSQSQVQDVKAEIHTHQHIYLVVSDTGQVVPLPPFAGSLDNSSLSDILEMVNAATNQNPSQLYQPPPPDDIGSIQYTTATPSTAHTTSTPQSSGSLFPPGAASGVESTQSPTSQGVVRCGEQSSKTTTNFVNRAYPGFDGNAAFKDADDTCSFLLTITDASVCQVRVDFVDTKLLDPTNGECQKQHLLVRGTIWPLGVEKFCGRNEGQHFYIEIDQSVRTKHVEFAVVTRTAKTIPNGFSIEAYKWGLWITQIACDGSRHLEAPKGCFQYFLESSGLISSFNFHPNGHYINNQAYRICIMSAKGACRISYKSQKNEFGLEKFGNYKTSPFTRSGVSSMYCVRDFLRIPDGSSTGFVHTATHDRYCGGNFHPEHNVHDHDEVSAPIFNRLITLDFRSGDPNLLPALNYAGFPANTAFNLGQHMPGFRISFNQIIGGSHCPAAELSLLGMY